MEEAFILWLLQILNKTGTRESENCNLLLTTITLSYISGIRFPVQLLAADWQPKAHNYKRIPNSAWITLWSELWTVQNSPPVWLELCKCLHSKWWVEVGRDGWCRHFGGHHSWLNTDSPSVLVRQNEKLNYRYIGKHLNSANLSGVNLIWLIRFSHAPYYVTELFI